MTSPATAGMADLVTRLQALEGTLERQIGEL